MPETAAINDIYQVRVRGRNDGQQTNNVFHFRCAGATDDVELRLIQALLDCFITNLIPVWPGSQSIDDVVWKRVSPTLGPEFITVATGDTTGGGGPNALPSFCSAVFSIRTALGGRSHRGRTYIPGITEAATLNSKFDTTNAFWLALVAFAACVVTKFIDIGDPPPANSFVLGVYSRKIGGSAFPYGATGFTPAVSFGPHAEIGTTRSRKLGHGN